ncbi:MAG: hypothetical protein FWD23_19060, partial [Oscillospiraceae bacterium]|nr:hypothetical protein [Oscillospiraceae bacterium]
MNKLFNIIKNEYAKIIVAFIAISVMSWWCSVLILSSRDSYNLNDFVDTEPVIAITYINSAGYGFREQQISDLYENARVTGYNLFLRDLFNLTLSHNNYFYT